MSKKRKVTLTLAAIIVALGGGAQFYTNQQVDQVLQKFPYSLDNQLSLNVTESAKNFFSRELTFSLENNDGQKTNIISTKLTALPFFITAESKLSEQLVRQLNKDLNITIDKNTINSKFSPVGDYLQSNILTDFRDFTNKAQTLSVSLDFNAGTKNVALNANLSGFNYDKNSKLEQIGAQIKFVPVGENQYDISTLELNAKNAEWDLLNGENTKIQLKNALLKTVFYFSLFFPVVELLSSFFIGIILFYAGYNTIFQGDTSVGDIIAFIQFVSLLVRPLRQIADRFNNIQRGLVGAERVLGIMDEKENLTPNNGSIKKKELKGKIEFKEVKFSYDQKQEVLKGISFEVNPGETAAIVGATGAGKSTIISLITRLYEINAGQILVDDTDIRDYELYHFRGQIGVVLQDVFLFHGSILENLTFEDESISLEKVKQAAKEIEVDSFIEKLPGGYNFIVSERGSSISLGQRQLLSFLRAYLSNPKILILDEATSSIDHESEKLIQKATEKITQNRTSIIIAHRLSTIEKADKIIVMHQGRIVETGTHEELLAQGAYYADLYKTQLKE